MKNQQQLKVPFSTYLSAEPSQLKTMQKLIALTLPLGELLTVQEVARCLNVSKLTVYRLAERQILPSYRFFRRLRFKPEDVKWCLEKHQITKISNRYGNPKD